MVNSQEQAVFLSDILIDFYQYLLTLRIHNREQMKENNDTPISKHSEFGLQI